MDTPRTLADAGGPQDVSIGLRPDGAEAMRTPAWEMIAEGRYQPRRIRGSCVGRELG